MSNVRNLNSKLLVTALALLLLSAGSYYYSVQRAERFERGQKFLPNLDPDEIARIVLVEDGEETVLRRTAEGDRFVLPSADGYRAENGAVNRLLENVLDLSLEKEVGDDPDLFAELGLEADGPEGLDITFADATGNEMVRFLVGNESDDGAGSYVRRVGDDETVFLTTGRVFLTTEADSFLDKEILSVAGDEVRAIRGDGFALVENEAGELILQDAPEGTTLSNDAKALRNALSGLRFAEHFLADAPEVAAVRFDSRLEIELDDGSGYEVEVGAEGEKHYLRIGGFHTAGRITISREASEQEVRETSEKLQRSDELEAWNAFHGSWIYEVPKATADKFRVTPAELVETG